MTPRSEAAGLLKTDLRHRAASERREHRALFFAVRAV
jgi:hypothetical protein